MSRRGTLALTMACACLVTAASCTPKVSTGGTKTSTTTTTTTVASGPRIERLDPDSARAQGQVVIRGSGFSAGTPGTNTIDFGGMMITNVAANSTGTEISFTVPARLNRGGEARPQPLMAGSYDVRVITTRGNSNTAALKVLP